MASFQIIYLFPEVQNSTCEQNKLHGEDGFFIAISFYDASCYNDMLLLAWAYTSKSLKLLSNRFLTFICTIHYGDKMFDYFKIVHVFGCVAQG